MKYMHQAPANDRWIKVVESQQWASNFTSNHFAKEQSFETNLLRIELGRKYVFFKLRFKCHEVVTFLGKTHPSQTHCFASCYRHSDSNKYYPNHQLIGLCNGGRFGHLSRRSDGNATLSYAKTNRLGFLYSKIKMNLG